MVEEEKICVPPVGLESVPILKRLLDSGVGYHSHTKGTYPVLFYTDPETQKELALKLLHPGVHKKIFRAE